MTEQMPSTAAAYVRATNSHDRAAYDALFADDAVVNDAGREFRGRAEIKAWSDHDVFDAEVTLEVVDIVNRDGHTVITTKVDGTFDRTGLPDPLFIEHEMAIADGMIISLTCQLAAQRAT